MPAKPIHDEFSALPMTPQQRWSLRKKRDGKCVTCGGGPLTTKLHCSKHAAGEAARAKHRRRHDPRLIARNIVHNALLEGKIQRGHCHCGVLGEAHHEDYSKPLEITWLCPKHHKHKHGRRHINDLVAGVVQANQKQYLAWLNGPRRRAVRDYHRAYRRRIKAARVT